MSVDSKKTILLEKKYLYVRASLGFQLEGTSTEVIPTNNGFYRFYVDNLSKALGNSYVNILYDSKDLAFQSFCSDLYMDELMSSDSSAIEDVVLELKKNTSKIEEFENGVSSALQSNHEDNVAISAKIDEFQSGVSASMASNHADNVTIHSDFNHFNLFSKYLLYDKKYPVPFSDGVVFFDLDSLLSASQFKQVDIFGSDVNFISYSLNFLLLPYVYARGFNDFKFGFGFFCKYTIPSDFVSKGNFVTNMLFISHNGVETRLVGNSVLGNSYPSNSCIKYTTINKNADFDSLPVCIVVTTNIDKLCYQILCSCLGESFNDNLLNSYIENSRLNLDIRKVNGIVPCSFDLTTDFKTGYIDIKFLSCNNSDLEFLKKCDLYIYGTLGSSVFHFYDSNLHLVSSNNILMGNFFNLTDNIGKIFKFDIVYTGVSSVS